MAVWWLPRSSREGQDVARAIRQQLKDIAEVTLWSDGTFRPGGSTLESLVKSLLDYDFSILAVTPDDTITVRGSTVSAPRDNVVFEAGLFTGAIGRSRTFLVYDANAQPKLPSDLSGVTLAEFKRRAGGNLVAAVGEATDEIREAILVLGPFLAIDSPVAGARVPHKSQAVGRCSKNHCSVAVFVHPVGTDQYWRQGPVRFTEAGFWTAAITIGAASTASGTQFDLRAFLEPSLTSSGHNPLRSWPSALSKTDSMIVRRA
jgi:CAP12/Pycsar effector protein, TIR domain